MDKYNGKFNKNINSYGKIRGILRYVFLYGCYGKEDFCRLLNISERTFEDDYRRIMEILDKDYSRNRLKKRNVSHKSYFGMNYEYYKDTGNFLSESYLSKTFTQNDISLFFLIQQVLTEESTAGGIIEKIPENTSYSEPTIIRAINKLYKWDLIDKIKKKNTNRITYRLKKDLFEELTDEEVLQLLQAADFISNVSFPAIPGYYARNTIYNYIRFHRKLTPDGSSAFLYRHRPLQPVLDEEVVWTILQGINKSSILKITYQNSEKEKDVKRIKPLKVVFDIQLARWYFYGVEKDGLISVYRADRIQYLSLLNEKFNRKIYKEELEKNFEKSWCVNRIEPANRTHPVRILFKAGSVSETGYLLRRVQKEGKWGKIKILDRYSFLYEIDINDISEMKPWIRSFGDCAEVLESDRHGLREELAEEWKEMLEAYGAVQ